MIDVYLTETNAQNGCWPYPLFAYGEKYTPFTISEQGDIVALYTKALEYWRD